MRRIKIIGLSLVAIMAISALVASAASASAKTLDLTWNNGAEQQLNAGSEFKMANDGAVVIEPAGGGSVTCEAAFFPEEQGYNGTVLTNNQKTDKIEVKAPYGTLAEGKPCASTVALGTTATVLASVFNEFPIGTLEIGSNLKVALKEEKKADPIAYEVNFSGGAQCIWEFSSIKGVAKSAESNVLFGEKLEIVFKKQKMKLNKSFSTVGCAKTATLTAPFQYQLTNVTAENGFFVFYHKL
jgi:hypothetical protein